MTCNFYTGDISYSCPYKYVGRKIVAVEMSEERLRIAFADGVEINIFDSGKSCCEVRYMRTDDDINSLVGHKLMRLEVKEGPEEDDIEVHETCFVEIGTEDGFVTLVNHNEHNGYYGGFELAIEETHKEPIDDRS